MSAVAVWYVAGCLTCYALGWVAGLTHRNVVRMMTESAR